MEMSPFSEIFPVRLLMDARFCFLYDTRTLVCNVIFFRIEKREKSVQSVIVYVVIKNSQTFKKSAPL